MHEESVQPQPAENQSREKSLEEQLAEAHAKLGEQREQMLRVVADADNTRKRVQAEAANAQKYALDSLEAAVKSADLSGVELVLRQLVAALDKANIREIHPAPGERFDPYRHQAMAAVESPPGEMRDPNTVVSVMQKGYSLADRILRPALVTVAKAVEKQDGNPISGTDLD